MQLLEAKKFNPDEVRGVIHTQWDEITWEGRKLIELSADTQYLFLIAILTKQPLPHLSTLPNVNATPEQTEARRKERREDTIGTAAAFALGAALGVGGIVGAGLYQWANTDSQQWANRLSRIQLVFSTIFYIGGEDFSKFPRQFMGKKDKWGMKKANFTQYFLVRVSQPEIETDERKKQKELKIQYVIRVSGPNGHEQVVLISPDPRQLSWNYRAAVGSSTSSLGLPDFIGYKGELKGYPPFIKLLQQAAEKQIKLQAQSNAQTTA